MYDHHLIISTFFNPPRFSFIDPLFIFFLFGSLFIFIWGIYFCTFLISLLFHSFDHQFEFILFVLFALIVLFLLDDVYPVGKILQTNFFILI